MGRQPNTATTETTGETDFSLHFMICDMVKNSQEWKTEERDFQLKAESLQIPGFLVKAAIDSLNGFHKSDKRQPENR